MNTPTTPSEKRVRHDDRTIACFSVVSRGGRPDLAGDSLPRVEASTLLIGGEA